MHFDPSGNIVQVLVKLVARDAAEQESRAK